MFVRNLLNSNVRSKSHFSLIINSDSTRNRVPSGVRNLVMYSPDSDHREERWNQSRSSGRDKERLLSRKQSSDDVTPAVISYAPYHQFPPSPPVTASPPIRYNRQHPSTSSQPTPSSTSFSRHPYPPTSSQQPQSRHATPASGMFENERSPKRRGDRSPKESGNNVEHVKASSGRRNVLEEREIPSTSTRRARQPSSHSSPLLDTNPSPPTRTRSRSPSFNPTSHSPTTPPHPPPPPRPRRSPRRSAASSPPQSVSSSSSAGTFAWESAASTPSKSLPVSEITSRRFSKSRAPDSHATFRLDRPQVIPEAYISRRLSVDPVSAEAIAGKLPRNWPAEVSSAQRRPLRPESGEGADGKESEDPEDWARQRRMSSLISGLGIVFGSAITSDTIDEGGEGLDGERKRPGSQLSLEDLIYPERRSSGYFDQNFPTPPSTPGSGSEYFESADEGDDDSHSSNSGRRRFTRPHSRDRMRPISNMIFSPSTLGTIVDNSPVINNFRPRQDSSCPAPSSDIEVDLVSVAFGYAYDDPGVAPTPPPKDFAEPSSVKQLLRQSRRISQVSTHVLSPAEDKRLSFRASERLALDDSPTNFTAQVAELVGSRKPLLSSYMPSPRLGFGRNPVSNPGGPTLISSSTVPPPTLIAIRSPPLEPIPPRRSSLSLQSKASTSQLQVESPISRKESPLSPSSESASPRESAIDAIRRERRESFGMRTPSSEGRRRSLSAGVDKAPPRSDASPSSISRPFRLNNDTAGDRLSVEGLTRARTLSDSGSPLLSQSKSTKRLSALFSIGMGRSRTDPRDGETSRDQNNLPRSRIVPKPSPAISVPSPIVSNPLPTLPASPAISPSPFSNRTWRSTMSPSEYETLTSRYGALEMRRQEVIWELCETEKSFVAGLCGVIRVFTLPLRTPTGTWIKGVPIAVSRLLDWLQDIVFLHSQISTGLEAAREPSFPIVARIADAFLPFVTRLEVHQPYLVRFESVTKAIDDMASDAASDFGEFVRMQSSLPECASLSLSSFLLKPVQRLMKYPLFFKQLCDLTPATHPDHIPTLSLLHSTDSMIRVMQEVKTREDEYEEARILESRIRGLPEGFRLARRDRRLVAHGLLRRVHINDKDRTVLEIDAMSRALSGDPNRTGTSHLAPDTAFLSPEDSKRLSVISDSSSVVSATSTALSDVSVRSWASPPTPASCSFETSLHPESQHSVSRTDSEPSATVGSVRSQSQVRLIKTKAKESSVYVFVYSDLVILATKSSDAARFIRSPRSSNRRLEQGPMYKIVEGIGLARVLGVSDLSGKTEHDHLIEVDLLPMPSGDERLTTLSMGNATLATSVYLTIPPRASGSRQPSSPDSQLKERMRWLQAFERSYLFALRSLSFPSLLNAHTAPITQNERLSCTSFVEAGIMPKSPSQQHLERLDVTTTLEDDGAQQEREERAWWAVRLKKVRRELEGSMGVGRSVLAGRFDPPKARP